MPAEDLVTAITDKGENITDYINKDDENFFTTLTPGYVEVTYQISKETQDLSQGDEPYVPDPGTGLVLDEPDKTDLTKADIYDDPDGIANIYTIYAQNEQGEYEPVEKLYPRMKKSEKLVDISNYIIDNRLKIRLEWTDKIEIDHLSLVTFSRLKAEIYQPDLIDAGHSKDGSVTDALNSPGSGVATLKPGEKIDLTFRAEPPKEGKTRLLMLEATGKYTRYEAGRDYDDYLLPESFAFEQNYPNPFNPATNFSFSLPRACEVTLDIYNVLGRKVLTLLDEALPAGRHTAVWEGRSADGSRVASGVYFARLKAGEFTSTKKIVVLK